MMRRRRSSRFGQTLVEVIVAIALISIVTFLLSEILMAALRIFEQSRAESSLRNQAELVLEKTVPVLRETMGVNTLAASEVDVTLPRKDSSGNNVVGYGRLQPGRRVRYYRGDADGNVLSSGTYLWEQIDLSVNPTPLDSGFTDLTFTGLADSVTNLTVGVRIAVTYQDTVMKVRTVSSTYSQEVTFRNLP